MAAADLPAEDASAGRSAADTGTPDHGQTGSPASGTAASTEAPAVTGTEASEDTGTEANTAAKDGTGRDLPAESGAAAAGQTGASAEGGSMTDQPASRDAGETETASSRSASGNTSGDTASKSTSPGAASGDTASKSTSAGAASGDNASKGTSADAASSAATANSSDGEVLTAEPAAETVQTDAMHGPVTTSDFSDAADLHIGDSIPVTVRISDPCRYFRFVPETTGMYYFYTDGTTGDAYGELFDDKAVLLAECDDIVEGVNRNFGFPYPCQARKTYYLRARQYNYGPDSFTVSVKKEESSRPQVYRVGDRNRTFAPGEEATLSVSAASDRPFTYVWTWDTYARSVEEGIPGADSDTITFKADQDRILHCTVIDNEDPDLWDNCTFSVVVDNRLRVWPEGNGTGDSDRTIITGPGRDVTLRTMVSAVDLNGLTYQWYTSPGEDQEAVSGATSDTLTVPAGSASADYACVVSDPYGAKRTAVFHLRVNHLRVYPKGGQKSETSRKVIVKKGSNAALEVAVSADSTDGLTYRWYRQFPTEDNLIAGADKSACTIPGVTKAEDIVCVVTDAYGNSGSCTFHIMFQDLQVWPKGGAPGDWSIDYDVKPGETVSLAVEVSPDQPGPLTYQWMDGDLDEVPGAYSASFKTPALTENTIYTCDVSDRYGNRRSVAFRIRTNHMKAWPDGAAEGSDTAEVSAVYGEPARLLVHVSADDKKGLRYVWLDANNDTIEGADGDSWTTPAVNGPASYSCLVSDAYGNEEYVYFNVSANHLKARAEGDEESGGFTIVYVEAGEDAVLRMTADSDTPSEIGYRWYDFYSGYYNYIKTENDASYTVKNCTSNSQWRCMVYDPYGNRLDFYFQVRINNHLKAYPAGTEETVEETTLQADENGHVRMEVTVEASNMAGLRCQWYYGPLAEDQPGLTIEEDSPVLEDTVTQKTTYTCLVRDTYGNEKLIRFHVLPAHKDHVHVWGDTSYVWSDDHASVTASRTCGDCGASERERVTTSARVTEPASCEAAGKTEYTASFRSQAFADQKKTFDQPGPLGHDWGGWEVTTKATVDREGVETRTCSRCGKTQTRAIAKLQEADNSPAGSGTSQDAGGTGSGSSKKTTSGGSRTGSGKTSASSSRSRAVSPRTGDTSPLAGMTALTGVCALSMVLLLALRKRLG